MNKILILTGCSRGLGLELKDKYLSEGYKVIGIDVIKAKNSSNFTFIERNLIDISKDKRMMRELVKVIRKEIPSQCTKIVLINNAALQVIKPIEKITFKELENSFLVNVFAPIFLIQSLIEDLKSKNGQIINILSIHTKLTKKHFSSYSSSKSAMESITKSLSLELAKKNIRVIGISPAALETSMLMKGFNKNPEKLSKLKSYHPVNEIGQIKKLSNFIHSISENEDMFLSGTIFDYSGAIQHVLHDPL